MTADAAEYPQFPRERPRSPQGWQVD